jgi:hypothetical protein
MRHKRRNYHLAQVRNMAHGSQGRRNLQRVKPGLTNIRFLVFLNVQSTSKANGENFRVEAICAAPNHQIEPSQTFAENRKSSIGTERTCRSKKKQNMTNAQDPRHCIAQIRSPTSESSNEPTLSPSFSHWSPGSQARRNEYLPSA